MSTTTQVKTFSDLYTDLQNRVQVQTGVTATENQAKRYINIALQDMHVGLTEVFPWCERRSVLRTQAPYSTGTVSVSKGGTALTGSSTLWNTANSFGIANARVGGKLLINGTPDVYEVSAVGSDTSITLANAYVGDDVSGGTYIYFEDEYDLASDFARPADVQYFDQYRDIEILPRREFRARYPVPRTTGKVVAATILDLAPSGSTTPRRRIKLWLPPDKAYNIPYAYMTTKLAVSSAGAAQEDLSADSDEPIVPMPYRHAIVLHGLYHWYRDKKNDQRRADAKQEYGDLMARIMSNYDQGSSRPSIQPRMGVYAGSAARPFNRGLSSRHTLGSRFDQRR